MFLLGQLWRKTPLSIRWLVFRWSIRSSFINNVARESSLCSTSGSYVFYTLHTITFEIWVQSLGIHEIMLMPTLNGWSDYVAIRRKILFSSQNLPTLFYFMIHFKWKYQILCSSTIYKQCFCNSVWGAIIFVGSFTKENLAWGFQKNGIRESY